MPLVLPVETLEIAVEPPPLPVAADRAADDRSDALAALLVDGASHREDPEAAVAKRSALLALFVAASCVLVTYSEFRAERIRGASAVEMLTTAFASETDPVPSPDAVPGSLPRFTPPAVRTPAVAVTRPAATPAPLVRVPTKRIEPAEPEPIPTPRVAVHVRAVEGHVVRAAEPPRRDPAPLAPRATMALAPAVAAPRPAPLPPPPVVAAVIAEPAAAAVRPEPIAARVEAAPVDREEDDIRSTLTRFRTAYSQLNASAAQEVWPSVDVRALRSAFRGLKSQELHFDRCRLTVTGARARAACSGRAVYVPGVGDQSPRTSAREWNFELMKARERWTIASARSS